MRGVSWYEPVANLVLLRLAIGMIDTILKESMTQPLDSAVQQCRVPTAQDGIRWVSIPGCVSLGSRQQASEVARPE